jgi:hypothetical protein
MIANHPFDSGFNSSPPHIKSSNTVATSSKGSQIQELKKKAIERQTQIVAEICQNRTADKGRFLEGFLLLKSKSAKLMKVWK